MADAPKKSNDFGILLLVIALFLVVAFSGGVSLGPPAVERNNAEAEATSTEPVSYFTPIELANNSPSNNTGDSDPITETDEERRERIERALEAAEEEAADLQAQLENLERYGEPSVYEGKVTLRRSGARSEDPDREYLTLNAQLDDDERLNISKWRLVSTRTGRSMLIPKASYLPLTGVVNKEQPVALLPGDTVYAITGTSPMGVSFRTNVCTGFFSQFQRYRPGLSRSCPYPEDEVVGTKYYDDIIFDDDCLDYIDSISRCSVVTNIPIDLSPSCQRTVANELNYNKCVERHKDDTGFVGDEWYLYFGRDGELWRDKRELIKLIDEFGDTVDYIEY